MNKEIIASHTHSGFTIQKLLVKPFDKFYVEHPVSYVYRYETPTYSWFPKLLCNSKGTKHTFFETFFALSLMKTPKPCNKIPENQLLLLFDGIVLSINCIKMILLVTKIKCYKKGTLPRKQFCKMAFIKEGIFFQGKKFPNDHYHERKFCGWGPIISTNILKWSIWGWKSLSQ